MADINTSLLQWLNGPGPQYKVNGQLKMEAQEGQNGAPYNIIYGADGKTPISSTNRFPVDLTGQTVSTQLTGSNVQSQPSALQGMVNDIGGTVKIFQGPNILNPKAFDRIIAFRNTGDQDCVVILDPYLNAFGNSNNNISFQVTVKANNGVGYVTNGQLNEISAPFDSFNVVVNYTTLPTSGGVDTLISETNQLN